MITVSLCMIVKNEEKILKRCLDSVAHLMDEIIIVDTGSTDRTREVAARYTDKIYDFTWCDDFSAARNFSFSKASMDYIYAPDADEYLDPENQKRFQILKEAMIPDVEIVQMMYVTPPAHNTVQNCARELRPKLFKRLRTFTWVDPIHETIRTEPVVYDSEIEIQHLPESSHSRRDFSIFQKSFVRDGMLSEKVLRMYAKELYKCGTPDDFLAAEPIFKEHYQANGDEESAAVLARIYRVSENVQRFFTICLKDVAANPCGEICFELGSYYGSLGDCNEAAMWFYNAAFETTPVLDLETCGRQSLVELSNCYQSMGNDPSLPPEDQQNCLALSRQYREQADAWALPDTL